MELLLEAPNWAPDGKRLLLNGDGLLWRLTLEPEVNVNGWSPDGRRFAYVAYPITTAGA